MPFHPFFFDDATVDKGFHQRKKTFSHLIVEEIFSVFVMKKDEKLLFVFFHMEEEMREEGFRIGLLGKVMSFLFLFLDGKDML